MGLSVSRRGKFLFNVVYAAAFTAAGMAPHVPGLGTVVPDSAAHAVGAGVQVLVLFWLTSELMALPLALAVACGGAFLFGAMIETLQLLQPARQTQLSDIEANGIGALCAGLLIAALLAFMHRRTGRHGAP